MAEIMMDFNKKAREIATQWFYKDSISSPSDTECAMLISRIVAALKAAYNAGLEDAVAIAATWETNQAKNLDGFAAGEIRSKKVPT